LNRKDNFSDNGIAGGQLEGSYGESRRRGLQFLVHAPTRDLLGGKTHVSQSGLAQREVKSLLRNQEQPQESASRPVGHILPEVSNDARASTIIIWSLMSRIHHYLSNY